jgi:hypothetical protein
MEQYITGRGPSRAGGALIQEQACVHTGRPDVDLTAALQT